VFGNGVEGNWQRSQEGVLARVVYTQPAAQTPSATRAAVEGLLPQVQAAVSTSAVLTTPAASSAVAKAASTPNAPGAHGIAANPSALWDSRLLFDEAGNVLKQDQFATSAVAKPGQSGYGYDGLNQLMQAATQASAKAVNVTKVGEAKAGEATTASAAEEEAATTVWRYHHDSLGNRLLGQQAQSSSDMAHTVAMRYSEGGNRSAEAAMDEAGRPSQASAQTGNQANARAYQWDAMGRLVEVSEQGKPIASYRYNQRGERVSKQLAGPVAAGSTQAAQTVHYLYNERRQRLAELNEAGQITRQYIWLADQLVAVLDSASPVSLSNGDHWWSAITQTASSLWSSATGQSAQVSYVHTNHLGAPIAMTDAQAKPVWSAEYAPFGKRLDGSLNTATLDLRLPGQWQDAETGLHYNDHRYYDAKQGRYISPDPLGLKGGLNAYAYVQNNPLGYSDPLGLILFAFDGTGNDESDPATISNVVNFRKLYQDGDRFYITGVATRDPETGIENPASRGGNWRDLMSSLTGKERVAALIEKLGNYSNGVDDQTAIDIDIDIVGFSRGAAQAREFANQINENIDNGYYKYIDKEKKNRCQKLNLRFMGLWDTVLSNHTGSYSLGIPAAFKYVAHATAMNEYRGSLVKFPLESILGVATPEGTTRIERGFLGAHSDIGGGFKEGDLAKVALAWMRDQAVASGVKVDDLPNRTLIANPVIHDSSSNLTAAIPTGDSGLTGKTAQPTNSSEDRDVRYANGRTVKQRKTTDQGMTYANTQPFITYEVDPSGRNYIAGTVKAACYLDWLKKNGYDSGFTTAGHCDKP
jgi:RHS repeat-associated protein